MAKVEMDTRPWPARVSAEQRHELNASTLPERSFKQGPSELSLSSLLTGPIGCHGSEKEPALRRICSAAQHGPPLLAGRKEKGHRSDSNHVSSSEALRRFFGSNCVSFCSPEGGGRVLVQATKGLQHKGTLQELSTHLQLTKSIVPFPCQFADTR